jgi:hypothetical protein
MSQAVLAPMLKSTILVTLSIYIAAYTFEKVFLHV